MYIVIQRKNSKSAKGRRYKVRYFL